MRDFPGLKVATSVIYECVYSVPTFVQYYDESGVGRSHSSDQDPSYQSIFTIACHATTNYTHTQSARTKAGVQLIEWFDCISKENERFVM